MGSAESTLLRGPSLDINPGSAVLMGLRGVGKSPFLYCKTKSATYESIYHEANTAPQTDETTLCRIDKPLAIIDYPGGDYLLSPTCTVPNNARFLLWMFRSSSSSSDDQLCRSKQLLAKVLQRHREALRGADLCLVLNGREEDGQRALQYFCRDDWTTLLLVNLRTGSRLDTVVLHAIGEYLWEHRVDVCQGRRHTMVRFHEANGFQAFERWAAITLVEEHLLSLKEEQQEPVENADGT